MVRVRWVQQEGRWTVALQAASLRPAALFDWLRPLGCTGVRPVPRTPTLAYAAFDRLPAVWKPLVDGLRVHDLTITPAGAASLSIEGPWPELARLFGQADAGPGRHLLTRHQAAALVQAAKAGYYKVPRPIDLRTLAKQLGASPSALSELLRRAEGRIISDYVERHLAREEDPAVVPPARRRQKG